MSSSELGSIFTIASVFSFVFGCCIGSFMNVVVWRLPRGESLTHPPSHCPKCSHAIAPWENIPIISWLFLRARCSKCHLPISIKYPLGEAATGVLFALVWWRIFQRGLPLEVLPAYFFLTGALLAVTLIDAEHWFIPDEITYSGLAVALLLSAVLPGGRLALASSPGPNDGSMIFTGIVTIAGKAGINLASSPILAGVTDCLLGGAMGFAILTCVSFSVRKLAGSQSCTYSKGKVMILKEDGIAADGKLTGWDELLSDDKDYITIHGSILGGKEKNAPAVARILANANEYSVDGKLQKWTGDVEINALRMSSPCDVVGGGDVKLMAMLGAFLGADASIYILLLASVFGLMYAGLRMLVRKRIKTSIPFGPFIALSSMLWILWGNMFYLIWRTVLSNEL